MGTALGSDVVDAAIAMHIAQIVGPRQQVLNAAMQGLGCLKLWQQAPAVSRRQIRHHDQLPPSWQMPALQYINSALQKGRLCAMENIIMKLRHQKNP